MAEAVLGEAYRDTLRSAHYPELARRFLSSGWLLEVCNDDAPAGWAYLSAAWACDDAGEDILAGACRDRAVRAFRAAQEEDEPFAPDTASEHALIADLLRRSHQTELAEPEYAAGLEAEPSALVRSILAFGLRLTDEGDTACHSLAEIPGP